MNDFWRCQSPAAADRVCNNSQPRPLVYNELRARVIYIHIARCNDITRPRLKIAQKTVNHLFCVLRLSGPLQRRRPLNRGLALCNPKTHREPRQCTGAYDCVETGGQRSSVLLNRLRCIVCNAGKTAVILYTANFGRFCMQFPPM